MGHVVHARADGRNLFARGGWQGLAFGLVNDSVEGVFELRAEDLQQALQAMPENRAVRWLPLLVVVPFVGYTLRDGLTTAGAVAGGVTVLIVAVVALLLPRLKGTARRQFKATRPEARSIRFRFDSQGFDVETQDARSSFKYRALYRYVEGDNALLLYTHDNIAQLFPKRCFDVRELDQVRAWLLAGVTPRKRKNPLLRAVVLWLILIVMLLAIWLFLAPVR